MKKDDMQVIVKLIGEINQLEDKNKSQEKFLEALKKPKQNGEWLSQMFNDSLTTKTELPPDIVNNIRISPDEWEDIGISNNIRMSPDEWEDIGSSEDSEDKGIRLGDGW